MKRVSSTPLDMKTSSVKILGLIASLVLSATAATSERWETLRAINWVENPTNHARPGPYGELGPYQFRAQTWRMHTKKPFAWATQRAHADEIAVKHYEWVRRELSEAGIDPSPYNIALAWNSGVGAVTHGRVPRVTYDYANRVSNLVADQKARRDAAPAKPAASVTRVVAANFVPMFHVAPASEMPRNPVSAQSNRGGLETFAFALGAGREEHSIPVVRASRPASVASPANGSVETATARPLLALGASAPRFLLPE
jgi:hypothetical protein